MPALDRLTLIRLIYRSPRDDRRQRWAKWRGRWAWAVDRAVRLGHRFADAIGAPVRWLWAAIGAVADRQNRMQVPALLVAVFAGAFAVTWGAMELSSLDAAENFRARGHPMPMVAQDPTPPEPRARSEESETVRAKRQRQREQLDAAVRALEENLRAADGSR